MTSGSLVRGSGGGGGGGSRVSESASYSQQHHSTSSASQGHGGHHGVSNGASNGASNGGQVALSHHQGQGYTQSQKHAEHVEYEENMGKFKGRDNLCLQHFYNLGKEM